MCQLWESNLTAKGVAKPVTTYYRRNQTERPFVLFERHKEKAVLPRWCKTVVHPVLPVFCAVTPAIATGRRTAKNATPLLR